MSTPKIACPKCHKVVSKGGPHIRRRHAPVSKRVPVPYHPFTATATTTTSNDYYRK